MDTSFVFVKHIKSYKAANSIYCQKHVKRFTREFRHVVVTFRTLKNHICYPYPSLRFKGGGGRPSYFFGRIHFEPRRPGAPSHRRNFWRRFWSLAPNRLRATPRLTIAPKTGMSPGPVDHRGSNGAPNCSSYHSNLPRIGFGGSRTNGIAVAAQNVPA